MLCDGSLPLHTHTRTAHCSELFGIVGLLIEIGPTHNDDDDETTAIMDIAHPAVVWLRARCTC